MVVVFFFHFKLYTLFPFHVLSASFSCTYAKVIRVLCTFLVGWAGNLVHCSHYLDRELRGCGSLAWFNRTSPIWCLERRQETGNKVRRGFRGREESNECRTICSYPWRAARVAQRLLQGVHSAALLGNHCNDFGCISCSPANASR